MLAELSMHSTLDVQQHQTVQGEDADPGLCWGCTELLGGEGAEEPPMC